MKTFLYTLLFLLLLPLIANSQNKEGTTIKIYFLMATTTWDVTIDQFDSIYLDSKYCKLVTLNNKSKISGLLSELDNLQDTIIKKNNCSEENLDVISDCKASEAFEKPQMDTRGKMIVMTPKGNTVFYYSLNFIWNSTENLLYKMNDNLRTMIIRHFFPKNRRP